jgi:nucleotide-binding universal stress UspA family protein
MRIQPRNILCATDFSYLSNYAVKYAITLAKEFNAKLYLCHVVDISTTAAYDEAPGLYEVQCRNAEGYGLDQLTKLVGSNQIDWEPVVITGTVADEIAQLAKHNTVDLVITAARGRSGLARLILGSVTERLMRTLECPLLAVRAAEDEISISDDSEIRFKRILVGCDFSSDSNLAFEYGLSLAQEFQSELHLVHVVAPPIYKSPPKPPAEVRTNVRQELYDQLNEKLQNMITPEIMNWCSPVTDLLAGHPHEEIVKYSTIKAIDLIVLGIRGHSLIESLFIGSTSDRVMRQAPCPVLLVRPA